LRVWRRVWTARNRGGRLQVRARAANGMSRRRGRMSAGAGRGRVRRPTERDRPAPAVPPHAQGVWGLRSPATAVSLPACRERGIRQIRREAQIPPETGVRKPHAAQGVGSNPRQNCKKAGPLSVRKSMPTGGKWSIADPGPSARGPSARGPCGAGTWGKGRKGEEREREREREKKKKRREEKRGRRSSIPPIRFPSPRSRGAPPDGLSTPVRDPAPVPPRWSFCCFGGSCCKPLHHLDFEPASRRRVLSASAGFAVRPVRRSPSPRHAGSGGVAGPAICPVVSGRADPSPNSQKMSAFPRNI